MSGTPASLLVPVLGGALLALLYLGALWASLVWLPAGARAPLWLLAGGAARLALVVAGFWLVSGGQGPALVAALLGFVVARTLGVGLARPRIGRGSSTNVPGRTEP